MEHKITVYKKNKNIYQKQQKNYKTIVFYFLFAVLFINISCQKKHDVSNALYQTTDIKPYFNIPARANSHSIHNNIDLIIAEYMYKCKKSLYVSTYNFNRKNILDAILYCKNQGVDVQVVGDIGEYYTESYRILRANGIATIVGNKRGIMHNKFIIIDEKYLFTGTGNFTDSGFQRNNNNFLLIQKPSIIEVYLKEFENLYNGFFFAENNDNEPYQDENIEIFFSPQHGERALERIIEVIQSAKKSIHYMIFAFTLEEIATSMIHKAHKENVMVKGIHDSNFIVGTNQQATRLHFGSYNREQQKNIYGPFVRQDGNTNFIQYENYKSGGKMHNKTMIIDANTENAIIIIGSFNWSNNAIYFNNENLLIIKNAYLAKFFMQQFALAWKISHPLEERFDMVLGSSVAKDGISIGYEYIKNQTFITLMNQANHNIDFSNWLIIYGCKQNKDFFVVRNQYNGGKNNNNSISIHQSFILKNPKDSSKNNNFKSNKILYIPNLPINSSSVPIKVYDKNVNLIAEKNDCS